MENISKIWGERRRIMLTSYAEIDLLYLRANSFCSLHYHKEKANKFILISGVVGIETEFGTTILHPNEEWTVYAPLKHRFIVLEDAVMLEIAFTQPPYQINPDDICRIKQGGRVINNQEYTENDLREKGMLNL